MSEFYDRMRGTANRLVRRFNNGGIAYLTETKPVTPNPDPLAPPVITVTSTDIPAVAFGVKASMVTADANIVATDLYSIVGTDIGWVPEVGNKVRVNGRDCTITVVRPIIASGAPCAYKFFMR